MSSLTDIIGMIVNVKVESLSEVPLQWDKEKLADYLRTCPTAHGTIGWHCKLLKQLRDSDRSHPSLESLCISVSNCLVRAAMRLKQLLLWATADYPLPDGDCVDRQIVISSLEDITEAFILFEVVRTDQDLGSPQNMEMIITYLKKTYEFMIVCSWIHLHGAYDDWLIEGARYLQATQLRDFKFHDMDDRAQDRNRTNSGVLVDYASVSASYLPNNPEPPVLCRNPGLYGQKILPNLFPASRKT